MRFSRLVIAKSTILLLVIAFLPSLASAQQVVQQNYQNGRSYFPNPLAPYSPQHVPPPNFANSSRIDQLMRNGQLMLSLDDAIAMGLENNLDIAIARYNLPISDTDILRAKSGQQILGVNTGLVQGTPGGGTGSTTAGGLGTSTTGASGSGTGGTTTAAGGAGTGSSGLVQSTEGEGPPIGSYDPMVTAGLSLEHLTQPTANPFQGATALKQNTGLANFNYNQYFASGTALNVGFNNQRQTTNSTFSELSPVLNTGFRATLTQHLLQGLSFNSNRRLIKIAKNNREISDVAFRNQVIQTVSQIENIYWDLVSFNEQVKVAEQALATSQKLYEDNKKQVEIGTLAQIAIVQAEAEVATRQQDLTVAQTNVLQQETIIKNVLSKNGVASPSLADAHIVPLDKIRVPDVEPIQPIQDLIALAMQDRPELPVNRLNIENSKLSILGDRSNLLPQLSAFATLANNGQAGPVNTLAPLNSVGQPLVNTLHSPDPFFIGGYGNYLSQLFGRNFPDYRVGVQLNIPIRNRAAESDYVRDTLNMRQAELQLQKQTNQIRVDVQNATIALQQARARYQAAVKSRVLEEQTLDAEQKKFALGASTIYNVIQIQRDLATAQGNEVTAESTYIKARNNLDFVTGQILAVNKIDIGEATKGQVSRPPTPIPVLDQTPPPGQTPPGAAPQAPKSPLADSH